MDNAKSPIVDTSISNPPINEFQPEVKETDPKRKKNRLILILVLIIVLLAGVIAYLSITDKVEPSSPDDNQITNDLEDDFKDTNLITYTYNNPKMSHGFSLQYPEGWEITKENTTCKADPVTNMEICTNYELVISLIEDPTNSFSLEMCSECSPGFMCIFSDSQYEQEFLDAMQGGVKFETFEEFDGGNYRRGQKTADDVENLTICKLIKSEGNPDFYSSSILPAINTVSYRLSKNADEKILKEMDSIVLSLKALTISNEDKETNENNETKFKYEYEVEAVEYAPDSNYVGFRTCDNNLSTCTVYGIKASEIAKATLGENFILRFNETGDTGAALGTTYIQVVGEFELVSIE